MWHLDYICFPNYTWTHTLVNSWFIFIIRCRIEAFWTYSKQCPEQAGGGTILHYHVLANLSNLLPKSVVMFSRHAVCLNIQLRTSPWIQITFFVGPIDGFAPKLVAYVFLFYFGVHCFEAFKCCLLVLRLSQISILVKYSRLVPSSILLTCCEHCRLVTRCVRIQQVLRQVQHKKGKKE